MLLQYCDAAFAAKVPKAMRWLNSVYGHPTWAAFLPVSAPDRAVTLDAKVGNHPQMLTFGYFLYFDILLWRIQITVTLFASSEQLCAPGQYPMQAVMLTSPSAPTAGWMTASRHKKSTRASIFLLTPAKSNVQCGGVSRLPLFSGAIP